MRDGVAPETACESGGGLLRSEIGEHVAGGGEADGVTANDSLVSVSLSDQTIMWGRTIGDQPVSRVVSESGSIRA
jgi:hypothetical protein